MQAIPELSDDCVTTTGAVTVGEAGWSVALAVHVQPGWKLFGPGSENGLPVTLTAVGADLGQVKIPPGELSGAITITATLTAVTAAATVTLGYQSCRGDLCQRPRQLTASLATLPVGG